MRKKLYARITAISVTMILITMITTVAIFYNVFIEQVMEDLRTHVHILKSTETVLGYIEKDFDPKIDNLRITIIGSDGKVKYDSNANIGEMDNHRDRPEVKDALKYGEGKCTRRSDTFDRTTYYYAEKLDSGDVVRVAKDVVNIWQFIKHILLVLIAELIFATGISMAVAKLLARRMVEPIEKLAHNIDSDEMDETYEEIKPFVDKIHSQHKALKKSSMMRQEFTANVSHELKTPLASISGYAELIETGMAKEEDIGHFASEIHKSANRLLSLINDIIELSELDVMDETMNVSPISLSEEAVNCVEMLTMNAEKHEINIATETIEDKCIILANKDMIKEVVYNLCDNAIRYNKPNGHVWVSVFRKEDRVILEVKDDGIGIPEKEQERIFERFYRVDKARSKKTGGTGLGLAIVKHIAEQHNAIINIESEVDKGTCISIEFPCGE